MQLANMLALTVRDKSISSFCCWLGVCMWFFLGRLFAAVALSFAGSYAKKVHLSPFHLLWLANVCVWPFRWCVHYSGDSLFNRLPGGLQRPLRATCLLSVAPLRRFFWEGGTCPWRTAGSDAQCGAAGVHYMPCQLCVLCVAHCVCVCVCVCETEKDKYYSDLFSVN